MQSLSLLNFTLVLKHGERVVFTTVTLKHDWIFKYVDRVFNLWHNDRDWEDNTSFLHTTIKNKENHNVFILFVLMSIKAHTFKSFTCPKSLWYLRFYHRREDALMADLKNGYAEKLFILSRDNTLSWPYLQTLRMLLNSFAFIYMNVK